MDVRWTSRADDAAVGAAVFGHIEGALEALGVEQRGRPGFVDVEAQSGSVVGVEIALLEDGVAGEGSGRDSAHVSGRGTPVLQS